MADVTVAPFSYADEGVPEGYRCGGCAIVGIRLYRRYQTFLSHQDLLCRDCARKDQGKDEKTDEEDIKTFGRVHEHSIGWLVLAVPTEEGDTYWGYTSVPLAGVDWWNRLPVSAPWK